MEVYNLEGQSGRAVVNQFVIKDDNRKVFQSYDSTIVEVKWHDVFCEVGLNDEGVEQIKKELRKGHDCFTIGRFVIRYYEDMR